MIECPTRHISLETGYLMSPMLMVQWDKISLYEVSGYNHMFIKWLDNIYSHKVNTLVEKKTYYFGYEIEIWEVYLYPWKGIVKWFWSYNHQFYFDDNTQMILI